MNYIEEKQKQLLATICHHYILCIEKISLIFMILVRNK